MSELKGEEAPEMRPLKITIYLRTPVALGHPWIHLDGIVAHMVRRAALGEKYYDQPSKAQLTWEEAEKIGWAEKEEVVPIKKWCYPSESKRCIYRASVAIFDAEGFQLTRIYKKFASRYAHLVNTKRRKISIGSGPFRGWAIKLPYVPATQATFYVYGDKEKLEELLEHLPGLGKKVVVGFGEIRDFEIETLKRDYSLVKDGVAMRPLPTFMLSSFSEAFPLACWPPYWLREHVVLAAPPGARVQLRKEVDEEYQSATTR